MFKELARKQSEQSGRVFLGAPEAEAEAGYNSQMPLDSVYKDYCGLIPGLAHERFLVVGRKGTGKSAFAEHICSIAKNEPNMFAKFIRQSDVSLEGIVQSGLENGYELEKENLYKWLILTNILKLFSDNYAAKESNDYILLEQFLKRNSGYIDVRESEVKELVKKQGFDVNISYLKRFFTSKLNRSIEIKQEKAPFYKLIPHLMEVLVKVLTSPYEKENKNSYVLFFDDLDIGFDAQNPSSIDSLVSLIRVSKEINNELFSKNSIDAKVVLLLRDDISKRIAALKTDTAKIFSSYSVDINWYQDEYTIKDSDNDLYIKKFINDRIKYSFKEENLDCDKFDPWSSLVEEPFKNNGDYNKSSFKYILDHTFFRPRDLLLFFKPLSLHAYNLPLNKRDINQLIGLYCEEVINELKNELSCFYTPSEVSGIFSSFGCIFSESQKSKGNTSISYKEAVKIINEHCSTVSAETLLKDMFERSLIGSVAPNGHFYFKHREPRTTKYELKVGDAVTVQHSLRVYCLNKGYA
ncbi:P-loop ATPase, Sll1717 family [Vibrio fluvialis]|uniref:P-loop ATPase, Sll1717 family n=1 Tax=Vibrio fluvialis TaxID=676 RepID=UPI003D7D6DB5